MAWTRPVRSWARRRAGALKVHVEEGLCGVVLRPHHEDALHIIPVALILDHHLTVPITTVDGADNGGSGGKGRRSWRRHSFPTRFSAASSPQGLTSTTSATSESAQANHVGIPLAGVRTEQLVQAGQLAAVHCAL